MSAALQRRVGGLLEQVHHRLADEPGGLDETEQLEPGGVGIHQDALLHLRDRIVGALQHHFELAAIVLRGAQRAVERALEAEGAQLARDHRLQPRRLPQ